MREKNKMRIYIRIEKIWIVYLLVLFLFLLLAFMACSPHRKTNKTAHNLKQLILDVLDDNYESDAKPPLRLTPVRFATDSDELLPEEFKFITAHAKWLKDNPYAVLVLEGHCDERGGDYYNMELGDRRARRVKTHLIENNVAADRLIMVVSYGERRPLDLRHEPTAWKTNRRVEFIVR